MPRRVHRGDGARSVNPNDHVSTESWWTKHAQPEDRDNFMAEARARSIERRRQEDIREGKKSAMGIHLWRSQTVNPTPLKAKP